jgi:hypothetical protein
MPSQGNLTIVNALPNTNIQITCDNNNWNCCDAPQPGTDLGSLKPYTSLPLFQKRRPWLRRKPRSMDP